MTLAKVRLHDSVVGPMLLERMAVKIGISFVGYYEDGEYVVVLDKDNPAVSILLEEFRSRVGHLWGFIYEMADDIAKEFEAAYRKNTAVSKN